MNNQFISYGKQWIDDDDIKSVVETLKSDFLTQGPKVIEFEQAISIYTGAKYCVAVSNGTAALHIAVAALEIEKAKEGITSPNTFVASSNSMLYNNITPVFADIDKKTYNISSEKIQKKINKNTKLLIPVHFAGQPADMQKIKKIADTHKINIIEDAAHAIGSKYPDGTMVGNCKYSDMTIFSFHPVKTLTTGEGGAITTNNQDLYKKLLLLRSHGITKDPFKLLCKDTEKNNPWYYEMQSLGFNYRMNDIQAALGISQLKKLDLFLEKRRNIVNLYNSAFKDISWLERPYEENKNLSAFHLYVLKFDFDALKKSRKEIMRHLQKKNIGTQVHYIPVYSQPFYQKKFKYKDSDYPNTNDYYQKTLSIPLYPGMTKEEITYVIENIINLMN